MNGKRVAALAAVCFLLAFTSLWSGNFGRDGREEQMQEGAMARGAETETKTETKTGAEADGSAEAEAQTEGQPTSAARTGSEEITGRSAGAVGQTAVMPMAVELPARPLRRETELDGLTIVVPEQAEWRQAGEALAAKMKAKWGSGIKVVNAAGLPNDWDGNALLIGNLGNNGYFGKLYAMKYTFADAVYPGKGGYQLQTLVSPFGREGNTVILAASDVDGLRKGQDRLLAVVESSPLPRLPWLNEAVVASELSSVLKPLSNVDGLLAGLGPDESRFRATLNVLTNAGTIGENYALTGNAVLGAQYKKLMLGFSDFINRYPKEAKAHLNRRENMWTAGHSFFAAWYVGEPSPLFSEEERSRIASAVYAVLEANSNDGYMPRNTQTFARNNHETYPAFSLMSGAYYFRTHYGTLSPELARTANDWYAAGERMFTNNTAIISRDDGSDYMMHVPITTLDYALMTGDSRFLRQGMRASADLQAVMIDNLGVMAGGGDVVPFGRSSAYHWGHSAILHAATWFYGDPAYRLLLERTRNGPFPNQVMGDLNRPLHRYATEGTRLDEASARYPLVSGYPVDAGVYDDLKKDSNEEMHVPQEETFHKLGFRQGLGQDDSYLLIDGTGAGAHNHHDANTILRYTDKGRMFIDARDYIERGPEHKNGVIVVRDGVQETKPKLAKVNWLGDADGMAISLTELPNDNGADWSRAVVSPGGRFYIIYDEIEIKRDGRYVLENVWQTLGSATIKADRFEVEQQGVTMTLQSMDDSELRAYGRYAHFKQYYRRQTPYPFADQEHVLREVREEQVYRTGDSVRFVNVLSSSKTDRAAAEAERLDEHTLRIREEGREWLAVWGRTADTDELRSDGSLYMMDDKELTIAGATRVEFGSLSLEFAQPVLFKLDAERKTWKAFPITAGMVRYDEQGNPLAEEVVREGTHRLGGEAVRRLKERLSASRSVPAGKPTFAPDDTPQGWHKRMVFVEEATGTAIGDLDGDGQEELIVGGAEGTVRAFGHNGETLWTYESRSRVNEVTVQQLDGKPIVTVAGENWHVHLLEADGSVKWTKRVSSTQPPTHGNLIGATNVRVAYVDGMDREPWIMVGTSFNNLIGLDRDGKQLYSEEAYYYGIEDMQFADFAGDGKEMGILGMEYVYPAIFKDKAPIQRAVRSTGPGWKVVRTLPDYRNHAAAVVLGSKEHKVHLAYFENDTLKDAWMINVGGEVNDILVNAGADSGEQEVLVGSGGHYVYLLTADGRVKWQTSVGDRVLHVNALRADGGSEARYLAGADNGKLVELAADGSIARTVRFSANIAGIVVNERSDRAWVILHNGEVYRSS